MENVAQTADNRIEKKVNVGPLTVSRVYKSDYQKEGTLTAELKQTVKTTSLYPTKSVTSNLQDNAFSDADFGFEKTEWNSEETRVAWIDVPANMTEEGVKAKLAALPNAALYRILSNRPILSDNQMYAVKQTPPITTVDIIANRQAVRYPKGSEKEGQLILDQNGKVQYKGSYFKSMGHEDMDLRTADPADVYHTPEILAELNIAAGTGVSQDRIGD